ncbi:Uma2 family endonuclease [Amycolatopsis sp. WGS_07]|uniref:Uma2 family endonuclease n=1 Tax=Amycolatopsis sp. WGS_07 TaxID=3076764 RepID=UPI0038731BFF
MTLTGWPSHSQPMAVRDLAAIPEDGRRHELVDGVLYVSPAPGLPHQRVTYQLYGLLESGCPPGMEVVGGPFAVRSGDHVELRPDVVVGRAEDFTDVDLPVPPLLVVEVLSPSTEIHDRVTKKAVYERLGVPDYWVVDPVALSLTAFEMSEDGGYRQIAEVSGRETFETERPFRVRVVPEVLMNRR